MHRLKIIRACLLNLPIRFCTWNLHRVNPYFNHLRSSSANVLIYCKVNVPHPCKYKLHTHISLSWLSATNPLRSALKGQEFRERRHLLSRRACVCVNAFLLSTRPTHLPVVHKHGIRQDERRGKWQAGCKPCIYLRAPVSKDEEG